MAGSIKWFVYTDDLGNDWGIKRDESNIEAVNAGTQDMPDSNGVADFALPSNLKPRYARYSNVNNTISRSIVILTPTIFEGVVSGVPSIVDAVSGQTLYLRERVGERLTRLFGVDTGLNDGDAT